MPERDSLEVDVLFVGAGPASLAGAIRLRQLAAQANRELSIMVIEKGGDIGNHGISGAVVDPRALDELLPNWRKEAPLEAPVRSDELWFLTANGKIKSPVVPPMLDNRGKFVASLQKLTKWLGERAEAAGVDVFASFPGQELLWNGDVVTGVRVGDKGVDKNGNPKSNYEPGPDLLAKITILGEGPRGTLAKQAITRLHLTEGREPEVYATGVKEIWQCKSGSVPPGMVIHTMGWPLAADEFGGGFIYGMGGDVLDVGFVTGLDYHDPRTDAHDNFQRFKTHPAIKRMLDGAKLLRYGAKAIPEGGLYAMPRLYAGGLMLIGDTGGFLNGLRLKGIHLAVKSGMLAAETAFEALSQDKSDAATLSSYQRAFESSWAYKELHASRNFHQGFEGGMFLGVINAGLGTLFGGKGFAVRDRLAGKPGYSRMQKLSEHPRAPKQRNVPDGVLTFDKVTDVFNSGTMHDEDQPVHLHVSDTNICAERCTREYGNPCQYFCPAAVYEPQFKLVGGSGQGDHVEGRLQINFSNCVHCKTCDIMDPYQIITWVPPQGGEGPVYTGL